MSDVCADAVPKFAAVAVPEVPVSSVVKSAAEVALAEDDGSVPPLVKESPRSKSMGEDDEAPVRAFAFLGVAVLKEKRSSNSSSESGIVVLVLVCYVDTLLLRWVFSILYVSEKVFDKTDAPLFHWNSVMRMIYFCDLLFLLCTCMGVSRLKGQCSMLNDPIMLI